MNKKTTVQFKSTDDIWPIIEKWAEENKYRQKISDQNGRLYQKGVGFWVAPMMLKVAYENQETTIHVWIRANFFVRLISLFILPAEMGIESGGVRGVLPRKIARNAVNILLNQLKQSPIQ